MITASAIKAYCDNSLANNWLPFIEKSYQGLLNNFVTYTKEGWISLIRNCEVTGLGGKDNRDDSFNYYISEPIVTNDFKGDGALLQATVGMKYLKRMGE